jgi:hypothetical protein
MQQSNIVFSTGYCSVWKCGSIYSRTKCFYVRIVFPVESNGEVFVLNFPGSQFQVQQAFRSELIKPGLVSHFWTRSLPKIPCAFRRRTRRKGVGRNTPHKSVSHLAQGSSISKQSAAKATKLLIKLTLSFFFSDEAWFHLHGHVCSQNNRYWSSLNPHLIHAVRLLDVKSDCGVWWILDAETFNSARFSRYVLVQGNHF